MAERQDTILLPDARRLPRKNQGFLAWMWFFIRPYRRIVIAMFFLRVFRYTAFALVVYFFSLLIDALSTGYAFQHTDKIWHVITGLALFYFIIMSSYFLQIYDELGIDRMQRSLTLFSVRHLVSLPLDWHEQKGSGAKLQRVLQARENFRELYEIYSYHLLGFVGEVMAVTIAILAMDVPLYIFLLFAGYVASYLLISWMMNLPVDRLQDRHNSLKEDLISRVYDFISLIRLTKSFSLDRYIEARARDGENAGHAVIRKMRRISYAKWSLMNLDVWIWLGVILVVCLREALQGHISIGAFSAILFMAHRLWGVLEEVALMQVNYLNYKNGFLRIRETLGVAGQDYDIAPLQRVPENWNNLTVANLEFSYAGRDAALRQVNMTIPRGKRIALVGHSGAGKSTLVKLLLKQIAPQAGQITVGDVDLKHIATKDWLSRIALVPQDVELMNASLRDNVLLDRPDTDPDFYRACLHKAYLDEFIAQLPQGDQTEIGERGVKLSGGQRQRLGIARALARGADIIIFDEATSSLDSESESHIQQAMDDSFADKTLIVIAHRLSTIKHADMIYVLENGCVAESGSFTELEQNSRIFARLWAMQSGGFIV